MVSFPTLPTTDIRSYAISALAFLWNPFKNVIQHTPLLIVRYKGSNFNEEILHEFGAITSAPGNFLSHIPAFVWQSH